MPTASPDRQVEVHAIAFQQGLSKGLTFLFNTWYTSLCHYVYSFTQDLAPAEEIASEAFLKTWRYHQQFTSAASIKAYIYTVAKRDAIRWLQKEQKNKRISLQTVQLRDDPEQNHLKRLMKAETLDSLYAAIEDLPPRCRQIFRYFIQGKKTDEIAKELAISPHTVKAQKNRGISLLKSKFPLHLFTME